MLLGTVLRFGIWFTPGETENVPVGTRVLVHRQALDRCLRRIAAGRLVIPLTIGHTHMGLDGDVLLTTADPSMTVERFGDELAVLLSGKTAAGRAALRAIRASPATRC